MMEKTIDFLRDTYGIDIFGWKMLKAPLQKLLHMVASKADYLGLGKS